MEDIFKKDLSGAMVSPDEPGYDELINAIWGTMKLANELNTGYHTPDEVRGYLSHITGQEVDSSVTLLPPFYVDFSKNIRMGNGVGFNRDARSSTVAELRWGTMFL